MATRNAKLQPSRCLSCVLRMNVIQVIQSRHFPGAGSVMMFNSRPRLSSSRSSRDKPLGSVFQRPDFLAQISVVRDMQRRIHERGEARLRRGHRSLRGGDNLGTLLQPRRARL